ncbi:Crp/Fnr family transcriptional regulator [Marinobacterium sp. D7]|uniref:Crp/Fnr family transcriptional regulator n=1 Tax=Marinobacterium ramblicola TaxID=2849041 RepID=UPI001C2D687F|nr:Crp/Fnr family transcriptional regulator [Marinobacterium ramblicola]MBV1790607.1 Crp/Fnr family transcriptional regulator [Marinobacterium ramblicola]
MSFNLCSQLKRYGGREQALRAGAYLFHQGDVVRQLYYVIDGEVQLVRHQACGSAIVLQCATPGAIVAEASLFSERYHCDAIAQGQARVGCVAKEVFIRLFRNDAEFAMAWAAYLARGIQTARLRGEILALKTVSERLDAWLDWHGELPPRGEWKQVAMQIAVSPEALYREIAKRRKG